MKKHPCFPCLYSHWVGGWGAGKPAGCIRVGGMFVEKIEIVSEPCKYRLLVADIRAWERKRGY